MSGSRKRGSKWNSKDEHQYSLENVRDKAWPTNSGAFHDRESEHGYFSAEAGRKHKWSGVGVSDMMKSKHGLLSRGSLHGSRVGEKDDNNDFVKNWNTSIPWDRDDRVDTYRMKMSPGLDDWGLKKHHSSPKADWNRSHRRRSRSWSRSNSRSRSRSPVRGIRSQAGFHERTRNRSEVSTQLCKEFMAGRCRRGSQCHFLHQDIQSREDSWDNRHKRAVASKHITHDDGKDYLIKSGRSSDCCPEYLKGNCRRGVSCRFAHDVASDGFSRRPTHEISSERENTKRNRVRTPERDGEHEVRRSGGDIPCKYFAAGNCRNGKYCRFSHHGQARASLERSHDDRGVWGPSSASVNKLHDGSTMRDADASFNVNKSWIAPERSDANALNEAEIPWTDPKCSDLDASNNVNNSWAGSKWSDVDASNDVNNSWTGSKWSDAGAYSGETKLSMDTIGKKDVSEPRFSKWSVDERRKHDYDVSGKNIVANRQCITVDIDKDEGIPRKIENAVVNMGVSEPKGAEDSLADMEMPLEWNNMIQSSVKNEHSQSSKPAPVEALLPAREKNITEEASGQVHHGLQALQPMVTEKSNIQQDHLKRSSTAVLLPCVSNALNSKSNSHIDLNFSTNIPPLPSFDQPGPCPSSLPYSNFNAVGQSQVTIPSNEITTNCTHNSLLFQQQASNNPKNTGDTNILQGNSGSQSTQPMVSNEQLTQLTNLSVSLAQLFGNGKQLPVLNGMQVNPSANSGGHVVLDSLSTVQPEQVTFSQQYDPVSDSIEHGKKQDAGTKPLGFSVDPVVEKNTPDGQPELSANKLLASSVLGSNNGDDYHNDHSSKGETDFDSHKPNQLQPAASSEMKEDGVEETKKAEGENGSSENVDVDDKTDEGKKNKDDKGNRAFKFALVEFVKDLLKPTWKEGQIGKEAYKNIVKKVVDKVIATVQGTNIPQTPEKIDQYLSFSKPKLSKLVQAYVAKFQKS